MTRLSWDRVNVDDGGIAIVISHFEIFKDGIPHAVVHDNGNTFFSYVENAPGTSTWKVRAVNENGTPGPFTQAIVHTQASGIPAVPTGFVVSD